ncbi:MAG: HAD hydrolase family protein, partial [Proteobacteria bacterium]|nr:HAD hydrolase family protein [Pseudomonadota bacterium]
MPGIIFTDLDGTLLSHDDYRFESALPLIRELKSAGVQIVLSTSKTLTEVLTWRTRLGLDDPFMVENGSALYLPLGDFAETDLGDAPFTRTDAFFRVVLGTP